jgi:hypothetical protein
MLKEIYEKHDNSLTNEVDQKLKVYTNFKTKLDDKLTEADEKIWKELETQVLRFAEEQLTGNIVDFVMEHCIFLKKAFDKLGHNFIRNYVDPLIRCCFEEGYINSGICFVTSLKMVIGDISIRSAYVRDYDEINFDEDSDN